MACVKKRRGRYVMDYYDNQGKRIRETLPEGTTLKAAKLKMREIEDRLEKGNYIPRKQIPLFKDVAKAWLYQKQPNLRQSTWGVYDGHIRNHFNEIAEIRVDRISIFTIETFIRDRQENGMHILTLRKVLVSLNQIMAYAVRHGYIASNPVRDAERPKSQGEEKEDKIKILNPKEIKAFINAVGNEKYKVLFKMAIMTGARQGELLGLKWDDIDWAKSQVHIQRTYNNQKMYDVKTKTSKRRIDLGPSMMEDLNRWRKVCPASRLGLIFPNKAGQPINHNNMTSRHFFPALKKAGISKIRFHDLRHTKVSLMIYHGENLKYIQTQMGHSSPMVTLTIYAHLMEKVNQEAATRFENTIFNSSGHKMVTGE